MPTRAGPLAPPFAAIEPMRFVEARQPVDDDAYVHEIKYDGWRLLAETDSGRVALKTRNGADATKWFPEITSTLVELQGGRHVLDGELCVLDDIGRSDFERLQARALMRGYRPGCDLVVFCVFDLLVHAGQDLRALSLAKQKGEAGAAASEEDGVGDVGRRCPGRSGHLALRANAGGEGRGHRLQAARFALLIGRALGCLAEGETTWRGAGAAVQALTVDGLVSRQSRRTQEQRKGEDAWSFIAQSANTAASHRTTLRPGSAPHAGYCSTSCFQGRRSSWRPSQSRRRLQRRKHFDTSKR